MFGAKTSPLPIGTSSQVPRGLSYSGEHRATARIRIFGRIDICPSRFDAQKAYAFVQPRII